MKARFLVVFCLALSSLAVSGDEPKEKDIKGSALKFLRTHVIGRSFESSSAKAIDNGRVQSSIKTITRYVGLAESNQGFTFDELQIIQQTLQDLDAQGKLVGEPRVKDRELVIRNYLGASRSTGELIGYRTVVTNTGSDTFPYSAKSLRMRIDGETLVVEQDTAIYEDLFAKGDGFRPGAVNSVHVFEFTGESARVRTKVTGYDVDPISLKRVVSDDLGEVIATRIER